MSPRRFADIPQFPRAHYEVNVGIFRMDWQVDWHVKDFGLNLNPDYQREHVWTMDQRTAYLEYVLQGGEFGTTLVFNHCNWTNPTPTDDYTILDGKQRLTSVLMFLRNEVPVFGAMCEDFEDHHRMNQAFTMKWKLLALPQRHQVLRYYLDMNAGGTPHTKAEIDRVRAMYESELERMSS